MLQESAIIATSEVIQLAVAPVFLLTGIGAILSVMTNRLSRIVDRARTIKETDQTSGAGDKANQSELVTLSQRARMVNSSISLCTLTALLVASVIAILFIGAFLTFDVTIPVGLMFVAAMIAFILAMIFFLREIYLATSSLRFDQG